MRRPVHFLMVGLLTFQAGVVGVWGYSYLFGLVPVVEEALVPAPPVEEVMRLTPDPMGRMTDGLRVTFLRSKDYEVGAYAEFIITNESPVPVHYIHFGDRVGEATEVRQHGAASPIVRGCGWGLSGATLRLGESARFTARVPDKHAPFEAGFRLFEDAGRPSEFVWRTVWSETIYPPAR